MQRDDAPRDLRGNLRHFGVDVGIVGAADVGGAFPVHVAGATQRGDRMTMPNGKVGHAELSLGDSLIMLADESGSGQPLNAGYYGARIMTHMDAPPVDVLWIETEDPYGPFGAKTLGEPTLIPTVAAFVVLFMRIEGQERWKLVIPYAAVLLVGIWIAFDQFMAVPWPPSLLGQWIPALKVIPSV